MNSIYGRRSTCPAEQLRGQQREFLDQHLTGERGTKKTSAESVDSDGAPTTTLEKIQQVRLKYINTSTSLLVP